jgi:hypothetical protein
LGAADETGTMTAFNNASVGAATIGDAQNLVNNTSLNMGEDGKLKTNL